MSEDEISEMDKRNLAALRQTNASSFINKEVAVARNVTSVQKRDQVNRPSETAPSKKFSNNSQRDSSKYAPFEKKQRSKNLNVASPKEEAKTSNKLLNFYFEDNHGSMRRHNNQMSFLASKKNTSSMYNKEVFLQANCQFVVKEDKDYSLHQCQPDLLASWDNIEEVRIFSYEEIVCPICLYPPSAGKITRCGHIYCWACLLHYLSLDDKTWRKCPICFEAIHQNEILSVEVELKKEISTGLKIKMKLMKKLRGGVGVVPRAHPHQNTDFSMPCSVNDKMLKKYSKLLIADSDYVRNIVEREKNQLQILLLQEPENSLESSYIEMALGKLEGRKIGEVLEQQKSNFKATEAIIGPIENKLMTSYASAFDEIELEKPIPTSQLSLSLSGEFPAPQRKIPDSESPSGIKEDGRILSEFTSLEIIGKVMLPSAVVEVVTDAKVAVVTDNKVAVVTDATVAGVTDAKVAVVTDDKVAVVTDAKVAVVTDKKAVVVTDDKVAVVKDATVAVITDAKAAMVTDELECSGRKKKDGGSEGKAYYFYQAADGQHIYMHPINVRCLKREYGDFEKCPDEITAMVLEIESHFMNQESRCRMRHLDHLPLSCEFQLVELDLKPPLVAAETVAMFADEMRCRADERRRRERRDWRRMQRYERDENKKMGIDGDFKIIKSEFGSDSGNKSVCETDDFFIHPVCSNALMENSFSKEAPASAPSFAQMLRHGKQKEAVAIKCRRGDGGVDTVADGDDDLPDGWVGAPEFKTSFGDALGNSIDLKLAQLEKNGNKATTGKQKKKKTLLFSTCSRTPGQ